MSVVTSGLGVPLSVLDLCPAPTGELAAEALRRSVDLARHAEQQGYRRYWVEDDHNMPGIASPGARDPAERLGLPGIVHRVR